MRTGGNLSKYNLTNCKPQVIKKPFKELQKEWYTKARESGFVNIESFKYDCIRDGYNLWKVGVRHGEYEERSQYIRVIEVWAYSDNRINDNYKKALQRFVYDDDHCILQICKSCSISQPNFYRYITQNWKKMMDYAVSYFQAE